MQESEDDSARAKTGDFPGGPVDEAPCSQCRGAWVQSLIRDLRSHMPQLSLRAATTESMCPREPTPYR